jgi:hypothetical protein
VNVQVSEVVAIMTSLEGVARGAVSQSQPLLEAAAQLRAVRSWLDGVEVSIARQLAACDPQPEANLAKASRSTSRQADEVMRREATSNKAPDLAAAMRRGDVSGAHIDAFGKALAGATADAARGLLEQVHELIPIAAASNPDEFASALRRRVQRLEGDEGVARLDRQRRDTRLRCWLDRHTGMWRMSGEFDPVTGALLHQRLDAAVDRLFASETPPTCPADPLAKQDHLRALALVDLTNPDRSGTGRPETIVVIDTRHLDDDGYPLVDWGLPVAAPFTAAQQYLARSSMQVVRCSWAARSASRRQRNAEHSPPSTQAVRSTAVPWDSVTAPSTTSTGGATAGTPISSHCCRSVPDITIECTTTDGYSNSVPIER